MCWRYGDVHKQWKMFYVGDGPAAAFVDIAIRRTAEMHMAMDPVAAYRIQYDLCVDDLSTGGTLD